MELLLKFWMLILPLNLCWSQGLHNYTWFRDQPGFKVLTSASHYWPLEVVNGILQLHHSNKEIRGPHNESDITVTIHNVTVLHTHNSSSDSAYSNSSATVDIVEGTVNQGIYLNDHLSEPKEFPLLYFGSYKNTCISNPSICGPSGVTFSFFWKIQDQKENKQDHPQNNRKSHASGKKVISSGFEVFSNEKEGYVVVYNHDKKLMWKAKVRPPGFHWTNVLFTWTSNDGLKIYVNGTFRSSDPKGQESSNYGDGNGSLVMETNSDSKHYINCVFDEFIIWERALNPLDIKFYFLAATGKEAFFTSTASSLPKSSLPTVSTDAYYPILINLKQEGESYYNSKPALEILENVSEILPNKPLSKETAGNLTQTPPDVGGIIETVDKVLGHTAINMQENPSVIVTLEGKTSVADYSMMKVPPSLSLSHYRFPSEGHSYISVPGEAFNSKCKLMLQKLNKMISGAEQYKDHMISAASYLISLKVEPPPFLSPNLSGFPLITIQLKHMLTNRLYIDAVNNSNHVQMYCAFLNFSSGSGIWSNEGCARVDGNLNYSVCRCNHLTNFAILMQVVPVKLTENHKVALSSISYIGCSLSIFCLTITLSATIRNQRYHIHANLSFAILVAQILLLISFRIVPGTLPCKIIAILLHFFFLSAFAWMLVEGLHLYSMVIKVFGSEESKHLYYYGIGWGSSLVICIVSVTSALDSYGELGNCWLSLEKGAIWAFVAPALFVIVVNIGILIAVTRIISRISADNYKVYRDANAFKLTAKAVAVLLPILGSSWIFGVLAVNDQTIVFQYMFAIFNSLQGFFIFLFHCLLNSEVRAAFKHKTKVWSLTSSSIRNINVKPFNSDVMNGNRANTSPTKMNTWDKSSHSANKIDLSAV
ncbi:hypothetical protein GDO86_001973 [Hymenochirus boettgeri]|uniref:Adhesion G-protein coupled receptor D1 n=1 Tax=Hymenochirus boettgeri TaxID=247094 RepID=A0A8T2KFZ4_9PIPI|nr:hypothetical protein GDO86_001973 [Hymenochirus boettgeri]